VPHKRRVSLSIAAFHPQACHMHAGYVLDQEGDSWAVAFHDADDAAAFSLQVRTHAAACALLGCASHGRAVGVSTHVPGQRFNQLQPMYPALNVRSAALVPHRL
jgi:hypothetical protein